MSKTRRKSAKQAAERIKWINCSGCDTPFDLRRAALSRFDNKKHICSECGQFEAVWQFGGQTLTTFGLKNLQKGGDK